MNEGQDDIGLDSVPTEPKPAPKPTLGPTEVGVKISVTRASGLMASVATPPAMTIVVTGLSHEARCRIAEFIRAEIKAAL